MATDPFPKFKEGISEEGTAHTDVQPAKEMEISAAATLSEISKDYALFTPAIFNLFIAGANDPVQHYVAESSGEAGPVAIFKLRFDRPIFSGLVSDAGNGEWNHWLYAIERANWPAFFNYLGGIAVTDRQRKLFARLRPRAVSIVDPYWLAKQTSLDATVPLVPVTVWCLDTNRGCVWIAGPNDHADINGVGPIGPFHPLPAFATNDVAYPGDAASYPAAGKASDIEQLPSVVRSKRVFPETVTFAEAIFSNADKPYEKK